MYGLGHAGNAATATPITDCWYASGTGAWLGINNNPNDNSFKVIPVPANNEITFYSAAPYNTEAAITVTDAIGRLVEKYYMTGTTLHVNTGSYAPGIYYYKVMNENSNRTGKFIITHN
jgi:hypothetical protein